MPQQGSLDLSNKYGNSMIQEIGGNAKITVKYGDFQLGGAGKECYVSLGYGNGRVDYAGDTQLQVKYSKMKMKKAGDVSIESKYSKIYIDQADEVKTSAKYDTYVISDIDEFSYSGKYDNIEIESLREIIASAKYTDIKIEELKGAGEFDLQYGGVIIDKLMAGFTRLMLEGRYTDFKVRMDGNAAFQLDGQAEYAHINYPDNFQATHEKEKGSYREVRGYRGNKNAGMIKARLDYGGLRIR